MLEPPGGGGDGHSAAEPGKARPPKRGRTSRSDKFVAYPVIATARTAAAGVRRAVEERDRKEAQGGRERRGRGGTDVAEGGGGGGGGGSAMVAESEGGGGGGVGGGGGGDEEKEERSGRSGEEEAVGMEGRGDRRDSCVDSFLHALEPSSKKAEARGGSFGTGDEGWKKKRRGEGAWAGSEGWGVAGGDGDGGGLVGGQLGRSVEVGGNEGIEVDESRPWRGVGRGGEVHGTRNDAGVVNTENASLPFGGVEGGGKKGKGKVKVSYKDLVKDLLR